MRWKIGLALLLLNGCVSVSRYRRDVDQAEIFGEVSVLTDVSKYVVQNISRRDMLWLFRSHVDVLKMRLLNEEVGVYGFPKK